VAILSRRPATVTATGLPGQEEAGARLVQVTVEGLSVIAIYCPNGKSVLHADFPRKLAWLSDLARWIARREHPDRPLVLCGDFNVCPGPLDSWNEPALRGTIFHTDRERARIEHLLAWGLADVFRARHPHARAFSWWDYRGGAFHRGQGLRIDLLLATSRVLRRVRSVEIDREYRKKKDGLTPSDHAPLVADLED
jgi:exodeoxyribonuclease-3